MYAGGFSPDGNYIMISTIEKPFSYIVKSFSFKTIVYDIEEKKLK
jgi:hypothetical protein